jgi:protein-S-isoprenylcysteine O-methyltransferase Ste14
MIAVLIAMLIFGLIHSILAGREIKTAFQRRFGDRACHGLYRIVYNGVTVMTLIPIAYLIVFAETRQVWQFDLRWELPLMIVQGIGLVGLVVSLLQIDLGRFLGTAQLRAYLSGAPLPLPPEPLQTSGLYAIVRHPLYLFSLLTIWPVTTMTDTYLGFCIGATLYFVIGSWYEERRLIGAFGDDYRAYQRRIPWLIPFRPSSQKRDKAGQNAN